MHQLATGVPDRPSTPHPSGWRSLTSPLALNVVPIGAPSRSARATIGAVRPRHPAPITTIGRRAAVIISIACVISAAGGSVAREVNRPAGEPAVAPAAAGWCCTSSGRIRWATPRPTIACFIARLASSAWSEPSATVSLESATSENAASRSVSWKAPRPRTLDGTWPEIASTGDRSSRAS